MYHTIEAARREINGQDYVCLQLYSYNEELLDVILSPQADADSIVMYIDSLKERHRLGSVRIATDIRDVLKRFVSIPGYLALYATPADLSRPYRMLDEKNEYFTMMLEVFPREDKPAEEPNEETEISNTLWERLIRCIKNLLKRMSIKNKTENR